MKLSYEKNEKKYFLKKITYRNIETLLETKKSD
jgi:hypothetical protein